MNWMRFLTLYGLLAFGLWPCSPAEVIARQDVSESLQKRLEEEKKKLNQLKAKIKKEEKKFSSFDKKETSLLRTLGKIEDHLKVKKRELEIYKWNMEINQNKIKNLAENIKNTEAVLAEQKQVLARRLRASYKEGRLFPLKVMFSAKNFNDLIQRIRFLEIATEYDLSMFDKYQKRLNQLYFEKENLLKTREKILELKKDAQIKQDEIKKQKRGKSRFLNKLKNKRALMVKARKELLKTSEGLNEMILNLEKKLVKGEGLNIRESKGYLNPPVQGDILNRFGKKRDKKYDSYIVYNGINIKTPSGTPVRAIFEGTVLFTGFLEGYGNLVIVGHGGNYHSLYGHLDEIITSKGKKIRKGQILGKSGDTGSLFGETLYFELRHKGKPVEPASWFKLSKK